MKTILWCVGIFAACGVLWAFSLCWMGKRDGERIANNMRVAKDRTGK